MPAFARLLGFKDQLPGFRKTRSSLAPSAGAPIRIAATSPVQETARAIRRELSRGPALIAGDFAQIKRIYAELVETMAPAERARLRGLMAPLIDRTPDLAGVPARRWQRRVGRNNQSESFPLEHLLTASDFSTATALLADLFPEPGGPERGGRIRFSDSKGNLSFGQYRDIIAAVDALASDQRAAGRTFVVERWADHRTFCPAVRLPEGSDTITIDVAQLEGRGPFDGALADALARALGGEELIAIDLEFVSYDQSSAWAFNRAFWRYLGLWERTTGRGYQHALPKGKSESHQEEFIAEAAENFAAHVRELERAGALSAQEELWVHEKAPGSGEFTAGLMGQLKQHHPDYYARLRVVLSDVSEQVLALAADTLLKAGHLGSRVQGPQVFFWHLSEGGKPEVERPDGSKVNLEQRFLYFRHANFFDQLPTRLFAKSQGKFYEVLVRAVVPARRLRELEKRYELDLAWLKSLIGGEIDLNNFSPEEQKRAIGFWSDVWLAVKLEEQYRPIADFAADYRFGHQLIRELSQLDDVRFVSSDRAIETMLGDLALLRGELGYACFTDIFLQRAAEFRERWIELAKYDNGVWVGTNAALMVDLLRQSGYEHSFYPVELTLGEPSPCYTMTVKRRDAGALVLSPELIQQLTGIEQGALQEVALEGLALRMRNNLRELPAHLRRLRRGMWSDLLANVLDLTSLLRELYYHTSPDEMTTGAPFVKMAALVAEILQRYPQGEVALLPDFAPDELKDLVDFLNHRPLSELPMDLLEVIEREGAPPELRLRLPTLARRLEAGEFVVLAEVDLPRSQSVEQLRRRVFQLESHVDALSITSGRMADPRFMRSGELLHSPLLNWLHNDRLVVTMEMRDRQAPDLQRDIEQFEARGVRNFFVLTGDFDPASRWWMDSLHGIQVAERLRNGEQDRLAGSYLPRSRMLIAAALTWSGIPDLRTRIARDVALKVGAGADVVFTQPVYDLDVVEEALGLIRERGLDRRAHLVAEVFPIATMGALRSISRAPGIAVPAAMAAAYRKLNSNLEAFIKAEKDALEPSAREGFAQALFGGVADIPRYEGILSAELAASIHGGLAAAVAAGSRRRSADPEDAVLKAARDYVLFEVAFALTRHAIEFLCARPMISGILIVARNGRELGRIAKEARALRATRGK